MISRTTTRFTCPKPIVIRTGFNKQRRQAQRQRQAPHGSSREIRPHEMQREDEQPEECGEVDHRPHRLDRRHRAERTLPGREEQRGEGGIGEEEARVGKPDGVQV